MNEPVPTAVSRYLDEVDALLRDLPDEDRQETLAGLREHLAVALGQQPDPADVRRVLTGLGDPLDIAAAAHVEAAASTGLTTRRRPPLTSRRWLPVTVLTLFALMFFAMALVFGGLAATVTSSTSTSTQETQVGPASSSRADGVPDQGARVVHATTTGHVTSAGAIVAGQAVTALPFFALIGVLVGVSRLWVTKEKVRLFAVLPVVLLVSVTLPRIGLNLVQDTGLLFASGSWLALLMLGLGFVAVLSRRAWRRADLLMTPA